MESLRFKSLCPGVDRCRCRILQGFDLFLKILYPLAEQIVLFGLRLEGSVTEIQGVRNRKDHSHTEQHFQEKHHGKVHVLDREQQVGDGDQKILAMTPPMNLSVMSFVRVRLAITTQEAATMTTQTT